MNLGLLAYFKYRGFFLDSLNGLAGLVGADEPLPVLKVLLPVGVSFYTFAAISYAVDVYRGMIRPAKSVVHYLAWATLFPYLMAGPIIRYGHVGEQLERVAAALPPEPHRHRRLLPGHGPRQEAAAGRHDGPVRQRPVRALPPPRPALRLGRGARLHPAAVLRLLGLLRHGRGRGLHDRPALSPELRLTVQGPEPVRLLAPLAHVAVVVAARLPVHPAGRFPGHDLDDGAQPAHHVPARRPVARPGLDVRVLGPAVGRVPVGARAVPQVGAHARAGCGSTAC